MRATLVILHGWNQSSSDWVVVRQMLGKDFSVVIFDLPGFGSEHLEKKDWTIPDYADWVTSRLEKIQGNKIILGHSFGGRIASYIASENPGWLKGLVLYGAPCLYRPSPKIKIVVFLAKILKMLNLKKFFINKNTELVSADSAGLGKIFRNVVSFDQTKNLSQINVPTLLVWGEYDFAVPVKIAKEIQMLISKSKLVIIDQVGHNAHKENPYLFYGIIKIFLKNI